MTLQQTRTGCGRLACTPERQGPGKETGGKDARVIAEVAAFEASAAAFAAASAACHEASSRMETLSVGCGRIVEHSDTVEHRSW